MVKYLILFAFLGGIPFAWGAKEIPWEKMYGSRLLVPNAEQAFAIGYDLPAAGISVSTQELKEKWKNFIDSLPGSTEGKREYLRDWLFIYEQNTLAGEAWQELLVCVGFGDEKTAERARNNYLEAEAEQCPQTKRKLAQLHLSLSQFLKSTQITDPRKILYSFYTSMTQEEAKFIHMPVLHPLFLQILLEESVSILRFRGIDRNYADPDLFTFAVKYSLGQASDYEVTTYALDKVDGEQLQEARATMNALFLLESIRGEQCTEWGLWPMITRGIFEFLPNTYIYFGLDLYWGYNNPISRVRTRYLNSCGTELPYVYEQSSMRTKPKSFLYGAEGGTFVEKFRDTANRYKKLWKAQKR